MPQFEEQLDRTKRWYQRLRRIDQERRYAQEDVYYEDLLHAFFQNCHHLKDWIEKDPRLIGKLPSGAVDGFINSNDCLRLAADICNASKHVECTKAPRSQENPRVSTKTIRLGIADPNPIIKVAYVIETDKRQEHAFHLATECLNEWGEYVENVIKPLLESRDTKKCREGRMG